MAEYISREEVLSLEDDFELQLDDDEIFFSYIPVKAVRDIPAADVAPVRRGEWVYEEKELSNKVLCCFHSCSVLMLYIYILSDISSVLQSYPIPFYMPCLYKPCKDEVMCMH